MIGKDNLTPRQKAFCEEYIADLNATQAAIRAGYSVKTAGRTAGENMKKPEVQKYLTELKLKRQKRTQIDADHVLRRLVEIDQMDVLDILTESGTVKPISEWPRPWRLFLSSIDIIEKTEKESEDRRTIGIVKKIKWPDKLKNLEMIGRHVGVQAFKDRLGVSVNRDTVQDLSDAELIRIAQGLSADLPTL